MTHTCCVQPATSPIAPFASTKGAGEHHSCLGPRPQASSKVLSGALTSYSLISVRGKSRGVRVWAGRFSKLL